MDIPLYQEEQQAPTDIKKLDRPHAGLWFERFFNGFAQDWQIPKPDVNQDAKKDWIKTVTGLSGSQKQLDDFNQRQQALVNHLQGQSRCYRTDWHFVSGMGNPHPVENGFSWHPTLAVPYLAGSAVKGLVRAWVEMNDDELKKERLKTWFGTADKKEVAEQSGAFIFFDAVPYERPHLIGDIMTPHMGEWYAKGDNCQLKPETIPADWHEPVPVHFLAVKNAKFIFSIAARNKATATTELDAVVLALKNALEWLGAGAKTATGYGYMTDVTDDESFLEAMQIKQKEISAAQAKKVHLNQLSPLEKEIEQLLEDHKSQVPQDYLLNELRKDHWIRVEDKQVVATRIKAYLQEAGAWIPAPPTSKKNEKKHQRTLLVMGYLIDDVNE
jgi:CRISPR-associated protein Cmr6